jgi:hypothetical protein
VIEVLSQDVLLETAGTLKCLCFLLLALLPVALVGTLLSVVQFEGDSGSDETEQMVNQPAVFRS